MSSRLGSCGVSRFISGNRRASDRPWSTGQGASKTLLRLMLGPHLLSTHLILVVHGSSAVRALLLVVHLGRRVDAVVAVGIRVVVLGLLGVGRQAIVRRLPATHSVSHMRAVGGAAVVLLTVRSSGRLEDLRRVVAR
jgi:hypothetical protein